MNKILLISSLIILLCIISSKLLYRFGVPTLVIFIVLGMVFGSDGFIGIEFCDYSLTNKVCTIGLILIIFYGGFSTNFSFAKSIVLPASLMSSLGVFITGILSGLFCFYILNMSFLEGMLMGAVVSSTDAASVFAILRSKKLNLNTHVAAILEVESGSNDPCAYLLTCIVLNVMNTQSFNITYILFLLFAQLIIGIIVGYILLKILVVVFDKISLEINGLYPIFVVAIAILSYSLSEIMGGNGYLSVYIVGIGLGNTKIVHKRSMVHFFDGLSWLMQIMLFFILGLIAKPTLLPTILKEAVFLLLFLLLIARPVATFIILSTFKINFKEKVFISFVGLRGASSIVFAIYALTTNYFLRYDIFHIVFFLAIFSVLVQGSLLPFVAKKLNLINDNNVVLKTFNDYRDEYVKELAEFKILSTSLWAGKTILNANIPNDILVVMIKRGNEIIIPKGTTKIIGGDVLILCSNNIESLEKIKLLL